jgi:hypothetical protein
MRYANDEIGSFYHDIRYTIYYIRIHCSFRLNAFFQGLKQPLNVILSRVYAIKNSRG